MYRGCVLIMLAASFPAGGQVMQLTSPSPAPNAYFGDSVGSIPDCDGDGAADLVVGAWGEAVNGFPSAGRIYIVSGLTGAFIRHISPPNDESDQYFGECVVGIPDLNGDLRGDLVVGSPDADPDFSPEDCGRVHVYSAFTGARLYTIVSPNQVGNGHFGDDVAVIQDLNGDGKWEIIVGAPGENTGVARAGRVYVFSGATGALLRSLQSPNPEFAGDFGDCVAAVPDINGDGVPDIIVGAPGENPGSSPLNSGRVYVFSGATGGLLRTLQSPSPDVDGGFGESVAGLADINGDGRGEIVVGAPFENPGLSPQNCGRVHVYSGATGGFIDRLLPPVQQAHGEFGSSVCIVPDRNGDGRQEILVGAPRESLMGAAGSGVLSSAALHTQVVPARTARASWTGFTIRAPAQGRAHLYAGGSWQRLATFTSGSPVQQGGFGRSVAALSTTGPGVKLAIGAPREWWSSAIAAAGRAYLISY